MNKLLKKVSGVVPASFLWNQEAAGATDGNVRMRSYRDIRSNSMGWRTYRWVVYATILAAFYLVVLATPRYATDAQVYIKSTSNSGGLGPEASFLNLSSPETQDAFLVREYILSADMLAKLEAELKLKEHFSNTYDPFSRLSPSASAGDFLKYYHERVKAKYDLETSTIKIEAQGFTAQFSQALASVILREADGFINRISQQIAEQETGAIRREVDRAKEELLKAQENLLTFQRDNGLLNAEASNAALQAVVDQLEAQISEARTEEKRLSTYLNDEAAELVAVRDTLYALEAQLAQERARITTDNAASINTKGLAYKRLELELELASELYAQTLIGLEKARAEIVHKVKHLVVVQSPLLSDKAKYPRVLYNIVTVFVMLSLIYAIVTIISATIREHRDV